MEISGSPAASVVRSANIQPPDRRTDQPPQQTNETRQAESGIQRTQDDSPDTRIDARVAQTPETVVEPPLPQASSESERVGTLIDTLV